MLREAGGLGDLVRMFGIIGRLAEQGEVVWMVPSRFANLCVLCPAIASGKARLWILQIEGVNRRTSRGPLFSRWGDAEHIVYLPHSAFHPDTRVVDLYCPAFIHEVASRGLCRMDRTECWARHAEVHPAPIVAPALAAAAMEDAADWAGDARRRSRLVAVSPSASVGVRSYRYSRFGSLVEALKAAGWLPVVFDVAGATQVAGCEHSLSDDLEAQIAKLAACRAYVGPDSGFLHIALACGVPSVGMFGPTAPEHVLGCYDRRLWRAVVGEWSGAVRNTIGCERACYCFGAAGFNVRKCMGRCAVLENIAERRVVDELESLVGKRRSLTVRSAP